MFRESHHEDTPTPKEAEPLGELKPLMAVDQLLLRSGFEALRGQGRTIAVFDNKRDEAVGTLEFTPGNEPPVRVRIGKNLFIITDRKYRIRQKDREFLAGAAEQAYQKRAALARPAYRLHPEALRREAAKRGPIEELGDLGAEIFDFDEVETAFTLKDGSKLVEYDDSERRGLTEILAEGLQKPHLRELLTHFKKNPAEAALWSLTLEPNATNDELPVTIEELRFLLEADSVNRGLGRIVDPRDREHYGHLPFYLTDSLRSHQPGQPPATWRLVRNKPLPSSSGREPALYARLIEVFCDSRNLTELKRELLKKGNNPKEFIPPPVEAFLRAVIRLRSGGHEDSSRAETTLSDNDMVMVGPTTANGIDLEERSLARPPRDNAGFYLSLPV